jgi:hypothetical protein
MTELTGEANATARVDAAAKTSVAIAPSIVLFIGIGFLIVPEVQSPWANLDHPSSGARHIDSPRDAVGCESQSALVKWASTLANSSATDSHDTKRPGGPHPRYGACEHVGPDRRRGYPIHEGRSQAFCRTSRGDVGAGQVPSPPHCLRSSRLRQI